MPFVKLSLGKFVTVRPRKDGTHRVLFEVPPRLLPSGWLPTTPLPRTGERKGDLTDLDEVARIRADAAALYTAYLQTRAGRKPEPNARTMAALSRSWQATQQFKATRPRTQKGYVALSRIVEAWAAAAGDPDPAKISYASAEGFLTLYDDRPTTRRQLRVVLKMLLDHAVRLEWRTDNPVDKIAAPLPETSVEIWEQIDVDRYTTACEEAGQAAIGALIQTQWEIGQRLTDARLFRRGAKGKGEYQADEGVFRFYQSKTRSYVTIPISARLQALIAASAVEGSLYLFVNPSTGRPFTETELSHTFADVRRGVRRNDERMLILKTLRHSCVVQLARAGCTVPEIASITGHSLASVETILRRYLPRDNEVAWNAQAKRGLVERRERA